MFRMLSPYVTVPLAPVMIYLMTRVNDVYCNRKSDGYWFRWNPNPKTMFTGDVCSNAPVPPVSTEPVPYLGTAFWESEDSTRTVFRYRTYSPVTYHPLRRDIVLDVSLLYSVS